MHDYYAILGVDHSADLLTLKKAFRMKVREFHPDRGGTHEHMVLVNEAWQILSDPGMRQRYDEARKHGHDSTAENAAAADAQEARHNAENNPVTWETVDDFLKDFTNTTYGSQPDDNGWFWPTASSASGWGFITAGVMIGLFVPVYLFQAWLNSRWVLAWVIGVWISIFAGAWTGITTHRILAAVLHWANGQKRAAAHHQETHSSESAPPQFRIIPCNSCLQKLRVPVMMESLFVRCSRCGHSFTCQS